jgi:hypothetical protein
VALNDDALFTAAKGYIYVAPVGTVAPSPASITSFDPDTTGSETQTVTITGTPTGGTFTLTFNGQTTAAIAYNAAASLVQTRLEALSSVGTGNVTCGGGPLPGSPVTVAFKGELASTDVALMTANSASLTGGTTPTVTPSTTGAPWAWSMLGHTSREDLPEFGFDGGDTETRGTWQNSAVKQVITNVTVDSVTFKLHQFDEQGLALYYGGANASATIGEFAVADAATAGVEKAILIVIEDGTARIAFHAQRCSILRDDSVSIAVDEFSSLPLKATFLKNGTANLFSWISEQIPVNLA